MNYYFAYILMLADKEQFVGTPTIKLCTAHIILRTNYF